jgi:hypothetical protein
VFSRLLSHTLQQYAQHVCNRVDDTLFCASVLTAPVTGDALVPGVHFINNYLIAWSCYHMTRRKQLLAGFLPASRVAHMGCFSTRFCAVFSGAAGLKTRVSRQLWHVLRSTQ